MNIFEHTTSHFVYSVHSITLLFWRSSFGMMYAQRCNQQKNMFAHPKSLHAKVLMVNASPCHGFAMAIRTVAMDPMKLHAVSVDDGELFKSSYENSVFESNSFSFCKILLFLFMQIKLVVPMNLHVATADVYRYYHIQMHNGN